MSFGLAACIEVRWRQESHDGSCSRKFLTAAFQLKFSSAGVFSFWLCHVILCVITVMIEMVEVSSSLNLMSSLLCLSDLGPSML